MISHESSARFFALAACLVLVLIGLSHPVSAAPATAALASCGEDFFANTGAGEKVLVIGEDMGRVSGHANMLRSRGINAEIFRPTGGRAAGMEENYWSIHCYMDENYRIIDIGPAPGRANYPAPTSRYYTMERYEIADRNYANYERASGVP